MNIGAAAFGLFCLALIVGSSIMIISMSSQQTTYVDTYNKVPGNATNLTSGVVSTAATGVGSASLVPLVIIGGVILLCIVLFAFYVISKNL